MNKLFKLKKWLTVPETAKHLSGILEEKVVEADVLRLALDRHLRLSVNLVNGSVAKSGRIIPIHAARKVPSIDPSCDQMIVLGIQVSPDEIFDLDKDVVEISGVWDLPMLGGEEIYVEHKYQKATKGPAVTATDLNGVFLRNQREVLVQLQADWADDRWFKDRAKGKGLNDPERYFPASTLPKDAVLVVRTEALREFETSIGTDPANPEQPMSMASHNHVSSKLATLNQAAVRFWANADRDDRGTHHKNSDVEKWLVERGYSASLADKAATIIRPEWAPTGRKPEE